MKRIFTLACISAFLLTLSVHSVGQPASSQTRSEGQKLRIFIFHDDEFWLNLHHFLYVLGRAQNQERDASRAAVAGAPADQERGLATLNAMEQEIWLKAVSSYAAGPSKKDLVFDDLLPTVTSALAKAGDASSLAGAEIDSVLLQTLERAAPIYRKVWWTRHRDANRAWHKSIQALVDQHAAAMLDFIIGAYQLQWPATGFNVHVSAYANWAGAYSTTGNLLVLSSLYEQIQGPYGLEIIFHEGMHQWDDAVLQALNEQVKKINSQDATRGSQPNKPAPANPPREPENAPRVQEHLTRAQENLSRTLDDLSHAMIFFTAGEAARRVLPGHVPYAEKFGNWRRGLQPFKAALDEIWRHYLDGRGTRDEALAELIKRTATLSRPE